MKPIHRIMLLLAAAKTILLGVYHFYLPVQWNWAKYTVEVPPTIEWALFSINALFSALILLVGLLLQIFIMKKIYGPPMIYLLRMMIVFWLVDVVYLFVKPMPLPESLSFISVLILIMPLLNIVLLGLPLLHLQKNK